MDMKIENINMKKLKEMFFLYNSLENGWNIQKKKNYYIFKKKHGGEKEIIDDTYLTKFIEENSNIKNIMKKFISDN